LATPKLSKKDSIFLPTLDLSKIFIVLPTSKLGGGDIEIFQ
jgi:hypothetical protein